MIKYYKFLTEANKGEYSEYDFTKYLPADGKPGRWMRKIENIEICKQGYHCFTPENILKWTNAQLFEVEIKGRLVHGDDKTVAQQMRFVRKIDNWNDKTARLFACYCARDVLPIFEKNYPDDTRPRNAIEIAEKFAEGNATEAQLAAARAAAWAAARDAAWDAAWDAARDAAWDAAWDAAGAAARDAAWDAAWDAAGAAAWDVAGAAARDKYTRRLLDVLGIYDEA